MQNAAERTPMAINLTKTLFKLNRLAHLVIALMIIACGAEPASNGEPNDNRVEREDVGIIKHAVVYSGHDYLFVQTPKTWEQAQAYCRISGYTLATINDPAEEDFLQSQEQGRGIYNWWIGYNDRGIEGSWIWDSGEMSPYTNWFPGNPDDYYGEDCAADRVGANPTPYDERWNDYPCNKTFSFICERNSEPTSNKGSFSYSVFNTSSATVNTYNYAVYLYAGQLFTVGTCGLPGASGSGDTYLRINNPSGQEIASSDDAGTQCGWLLSNISLVAAVTGTYVIRAGCFSSGACSGVVTYSY
jgi:hypothetical protein